MIHQWRRFMAIGALGAGFMLAGDTGWANAQPTGVSLPGAPPPADCIVAARMVEEWLTATPTAAGTPAPMPSETGGKPADEATVEAIAELVWQSVACTNANDLGRSLALHSDHALARMFDGPGRITVDELDAFLDIQPTVVGADSQLALVSVSDFRQFEDGRVTAVVTTRNPTGAYVDRLLFVFENGRWLIDGSVPLDAESTPTG